MLKLERLQNFKATPRNLRLVVTGSRWGVYVSANATVLDVALVMSSLRCDLDATPATMARGFFLKPRDPDAPAPTPAEFAAILERGFDLETPSQLVARPL